MQLNSRIKRTYEVHRVPDEHKTKRVITKLIAESKRKNTEDGLVQETIADKEPQFDVFFPQGHSIRVRGALGLKQLGLREEGGGLIDMDTGEEIADQQMLSLRDLVERNTQMPRFTHGQAVEA